MEGFIILFGIVCKPRGLRAGGMERLVMDRSGREAVRRGIVRSRRERGDPRIRLKKFVLATRNRYSKLTKGIEKHPTGLI
jgi:hypothetical protein